MSFWCGSHSGTGKMYNNLFVTGNCALASMVGLLVIVLIVVNPCNMVGKR